MMRRAWCVGVTATSVLLMASTALAQSFCSDLDPLVKLAPSGFRSILDDANGGPFEKRVTRTLPGASRCWYENGAEAYWCAWDVPSAQVESHVKQLADAIGQCYHVQPDYETTSAGDEVVAFVDLPNSISVYINGVGGMVALAIGGARGAWPRQLCYAVPSRSAPRWAARAGGARLLSRGRAGSGRGSNP